MIRVGILAPAQALRAGLRALLEAEEGLEVIAEGASPVQVEEHAAEIDVLVVTGSEWGEGVEAWLPDFEQGAILFLASTRSEARDLIPGLGTSVWGILPLESGGDELLAAVMALHHGLIVGAPSLLEAAFDRQQGEFGLEEGDQPLEPLTDRESQVLELLAQGLANKQIAAALSISEHTVKFHVSSIYSKLGAASRTEAVRLGVRQGLIAL